MNLWQHYICPTTLSEALQALHNAPSAAAPIAGGTDMLLDLEQGRHAPAEILVDLCSVRELTCLETRGDQLFVGAAVPLSRIAGDSLVQQHAQALAEACELIGGPQVRNVATLGGNVAHALPAADGTIALVALDAIAEVASLSGARRLPIQQLFHGPGRSALRPGRDLIVGFYMRLSQPGEASAFRRIMRPQGVALPIINVAVWLKRKGYLVDAARLAVGPAGPTPRRATEIEQLFSEKPFSADICRAAAGELAQRAMFRSSPRRASSDYRRQLVQPLLTEALEAAWSRTR